MVTVMCQLGLVQQLKKNKLVKKKKKANIKAEYLLGVNTFLVLWSDETET